MGSALEQSANQARAAAPASALVNPISVDESQNANNPDEACNASSVNNTNSDSGAQIATADNTTSINPNSIPKTPNTGSHNAAIGSIQPSIDHSTKQPESHATDVSENGITQGTLSRQEQARLKSLKAMLNASNARYKQATRNRRPKFSAGLEIMIISGDHAGQIGVVLDADYIANRALISLSDQESPHWIAFRFLGHAD